MDTLGVLLRILELNYDLVTLFLGRMQFIIKILQQNTKSYFRN